MAIADSHSVGNGKQEQMAEEDWGRRTCQLVELGMFPQKEAPLKVVYEVLLWRPCLSLAISNA